ncbi:MAG: hypothetical protein J6D28_05755 [Bacilli bacterium]|nr:hypothetical protein [Bacilli bacterium]
MYNFIPVAFGTIIFLLGIFMVASPKKSTKEELRNDEKMVSKTRKNGFIVIICGLVILVMSIIRLV